ncbi:hypothetical protein [Spirosoma sp.]|uniref:hypothetical protein n=1 Tax=Spirosoma sp. TaxID=1899569 RepID=UPI003B3ADF9E
MRQSLLTTSVLLAGLLGFAIYCWFLVNWYQDITLAHYEYHPVEIILKSVAILAYCYLAFRFFQLKLKTIRTFDER